MAEEKARKDLKIALVTSDGGFVAHVVCPFNPPPAVIVWGSRTFVPADGTQIAQAAVESDFRCSGVVYAETFSWYVPNSFVETSL